MTSTPIDEEQVEAEFFLSKRKMMATIIGFLAAMAFIVFGAMEVFDTEQLDLKTPSTRWINVFPPAVVAWALLTFTLPGGTLLVGMGICKLLQRDPMVVLLPDRIRYLTFSFSKDSFALMDYREIKKSDIKQIRESRNQGHLTAVLRYQVAGEYGLRNLRFVVSTLDGPRNSIFRRILTWASLPES